MNWLEGVALREIRGCFSFTLVAGLHLVDAAGEECSCFGGGGWQAGHDDCPEGVFVTGRGKTDRVVHFGERFDSWEGWEVVGH